MSFDSQPRTEDGRFSEKQGTVPEVALDETPGPHNEFLLPGRECDCDVDFRCPNHDTEAEAAYYAALLDNDRPSITRTRDAHSFDDRWDI